MSVLKSKTLVFLAFLLFAAIALTGCGGSNQQEPEKSTTEKSSTETSSADAKKEPYKIGAVLDSSGPASSLGIPERNTVQMLVDEINKKGGINGHPIDLIMLDTKSNETEAALAAKKLIQQDVLAIVGASTSGSTMAMVESVQSAKIPLVSAAASIKIVEPVNERQWVFKTAQSDNLVISKMAEYLKSKGISKVGFISVNDAYGDSGRAEFIKVAAKEGIEIVVQEKFEKSDSMMTAQLTNIKKANPQAVVAWAIPPAASTLTANFRQMGLTMPLLHSHGIGNQTFIDLAGDAANGVIFPIGKLVVRDTLPNSDPQYAALNGYAEQYKAAGFGAVDTFGGHAHDALMLVVKAIEKAGADKAKIRDELEASKNFVGITGVFNMSATDHNGLALTDLVMVEIKDKKAQLMK